LLLHKNDVVTALRGVIPTVLAELLKTMTSRRAYNRKIRGRRKKTTTTAAGINKRLES
jgi:hypothetical protein